MDFQAKEFGMTWRRTAAVPESFGENIIIDSATAVPTDKAVLSFVRLFFAVKTLMSMPKMTGTAVALSSSTAHSGFDEEFGDEIILSLGEVKLVNQKIAAARPLALFIFTNQKRIEESGRGDGKQFALPAVLLVNDQVKIIEVASGVDGLLPGFFREIP
jgi:hypothetical protein